MIDYEIASLVESVLNSAERLHFAAEMRPDAVIPPLEQQLCLEARQLYSRYTALVAWSEEIDEKMEAEVRSALLAAKEASSFRQNEYSEVIARKPVELEDFLRKQRAINRSLAEIA